MAEKLIKFNSGIIKLLFNSIILTQKGQCKNLSTISLKPVASISNKGVTHALLTLKD